jgi:hypothetical protein
MYSAVDPIYMVMLIRLLGKDYVVWDKAASIQFKKPGRETLHARFVVTHEELSAIRAALGKATLRRPHLLDRAERFFGNRLRDGGETYLYSQAVAGC